MEPEKIESMAKSKGWQFICHQPEICMVSFQRNGVRINVYYSKMTVATCLNHPKKGKTQLFRKHVTADLLNQILSKPRVHTNIGYQRKD